MTDWVDRADRLATEAVARGDATGWFEALYAEGRAGDVAIPWDSGRPRVTFVEWARERGLRGGGRRAVVVGCGLGQEAEHVAGLGFATVAFDIAPTAIALCRKRFPESTVDYRTADLFAPPGAWRRAFDLVVEVYTVQALPPPVRAPAIANVAGLVAPGGTLIVIAAARLGAADAARSGPPWPLSRAEVDGFAADGLAPVAVDCLPDEVDPAVARWRAEFHRPGGQERGSATSASSASPASRVTREE